MHAIKTLHNIVPGEHVGVGDTIGEVGVGDTIGEVVVGTTELGIIVLGVTSALVKNV